MTKLGCAILVVAALAGCERAMTEARVKPLERVDFFANRNSSRPAVPGTVPRHADDIATEQTVDLVRGRERYEIYCAPCHASSGRGDGPMIRHGFPRPPSLRSGHGARHGLEQIVDVIANGTGTMPPYSDQLSARDRRAVAAYVLTLRGAEASR